MKEIIKDGDKKYCCCCGKEEETIIKIKKFMRQAIRKTYCKGCGNLINAEVLEDKSGI